MKPKSYRKPPDRPCLQCDHCLTLFETTPPYCSALAQTQQIARRLSFMPDSCLLGDLCNIGGDGKWPEDRVFEFGTCDEFQGNTDVFTGLKPGRMEVAK